MIDFDRWPCQSRTREQEHASVLVPHYDRSCASAEEGRAARAGLLVAHAAALVLRVEFRK